MSNPYVGEIRIFAGNFAPLGWALCQGQVLSIAEYETLFNLIGTTYGGDGSSTFALPDLRGRLPLHQGTGPGLSPRSMGQAGGAEQVALTEAQLPAHSHTVLASTTFGKAAPGPAAMLSAGAIQVFGNGAANTPMAPAAVTTSAGGNQPHANMPPFLGVNYIISLSGVFPSPT